MPQCRPLFPLPLYPAPPISPSPNTPQDSGSPCPPDYEAHSNFTFFTYVALLARYLRLKKLEDVTQRLIFVFCVIQMVGPFEFDF